MLVRTTGAAGGGGGRVGADVDSYLAIRIHSSSTTTMTLSRQTLSLRNCVVNLPRQRYLKERLKLRLVISID